MNRPELRQEWLNLSSAWIKEVREGKNSNRVGLLDTPVLEACGDVKGLRMLDCGCGEGRFCRMLVERGATHVLGLDLCEPLIEAARQLQSEREIIEPTVTNERVAQYPDLEDELRVPNFIIYLLGKS